MAMTNPTQFITGVALAFTSILAAILVGWQGDYIMSGFTNSTNGFIPASVVSKAQVGAGLAAYNGMQATGAQNYMMNLFWVVDICLILLGLWFVYQGAVIEQGAETMVRSKFG